MGIIARQLNRLKRTGFHADAAVTATFDIQIGRFPRVGLHDGTRLADLQRRTLLAGLTKVKIDADADQTRHCAEYTRKGYAKESRIYAMSTLPESLIEIREHDAPDYKPLIDYGAWRVALMNYTSALVPGKIYRMQKHIETDEVFVLLAGRCILFLGEGEDAVTSVHAVDMELTKLYNVKRGVWHSHTFSEDAKVLIVENRDTVDENSPFVGLSAEQQKQIVDLTKKFWR